MSRFDCEDGINERAWEVPTRQEMFDRAWRGLKSQGWRQAIEVRDDGWTVCKYLTDDGLRCAWGWVDTDINPALTGTVGLLRRGGHGLAARLSDEDALFADDLQCAHDVAEDSGKIRSNLARLADRYGLSIPDEEV